MKLPWRPNAMCNAYFFKNVHSIFLHNIYMHFQFVDFMIFSLFLSNGKFQVQNVRAMNANAWNS